VLLGLAAVLVDAIEDFAHVFDLFEERIGDENGAFLGGSESEAIAGARVDFDNFACYFVLLLEDEASEVGGVFQFGDDDAFDADAETFKNALNEIMSERPLFGRVAEEHADNHAHVWFDVDDEDFFVVAYEESTPAVGGQNTPDLNRHDIVLHDHSVGRKWKKTSPPPARAKCSKRVICNRVR